MSGVRVPGPPGPAISLVTCKLISPEITGYLRTKVQGLPHDSHTRLQIVPYTAALKFDPSKNCLLVEYVSEPR